MPTVDGKKFSYTPAGMRAAAKARGAKGNPVTGFSPNTPPKKPVVTPKAKNPDEIKTKADLLAGNLGSTIKNMGGGY